MRICPKISHSITGELHLLCVSQLLTLPYTLNFRSNPTPISMRAYMKLIDRLGIPLAFLDTRPGTTTLVVLLHSLPSIRLIEIKESNVDLLIQPITLILGGQLRGGVPFCLQNLEALIVSGVAEDSLLPLVKMLPKLLRLECSGWEAKPAATEPPPLETTSPASTASRLTDISIQNAIVYSPELTTLIRLAVNLRTFQYSPSLSGCYEWDEWDDSDEDEDEDDNAAKPVRFNSVRVAEALGAHYQSLTIISIWWGKPEHRSDDYETMQVLKATGVMGSLCALRALTVLEIPIHLLISTPKELPEGENILSILPSYLPPSIRSLKFLFLENWTLDHLVGALHSIGEWEDRLVHFPSLTTFGIAHQMWNENGLDVDGAEDDGTLNFDDVPAFRKGLQKFGMEIFPPLLNGELNAVGCCLTHAEIVFSLDENQDSDDSDIDGGLEEVVEENEEDDDEEDEEEEPEEEGENSDEYDDVDSE